jgi:hypothetical protein
VYLSTDLNIELIIIPLSTIFKTTTTRGQRNGGLFLFILTVLEFCESRMAISNPEFTSGYLELV